MDRQDPGELGSLIAKASDVPCPGARGQRERERALVALVPVLTRGARSAGVRAVVAGRWLADVVADVAPRLPSRDASTLRLHYPGLTDRQIAEQLISTATKTTAALGAAAGGLAAVEFVSLPLLMAAPVQLAAEALVVIAIELKLVAELHEVMGIPARGSLTERGSAYLMAWVGKRAILPQAGVAELSGVLSLAAKRELRSQVLRRFGRGASTLLPFMAGAVAGAEANRRATRALGDRLLQELDVRPSSNGSKWFRRLS